MNTNSYLDHQIFPDSDSFFYPLNHPNYSDNHEHEGFDSDYTPLIGSDYTPSIDSDYTPLLNSDLTPLINIAEVNENSIEIPIHSTKKRKRSEINESDEEKQEQKILKRQRYNIIKQQRMRLMQSNQDLCISKVENLIEIYQQSFHSQPGCLSIDYYHPQPHLLNATNKTQSVTHYLETIPLIIRNLAYVFDADMKALMEENRKLKTENEQLKQSFFSSGL